MNKGISSISYDQFGNLFKVTFGNKSSIEYVYSADGVKLKARHITAIPQSTGSSSSSTNYIMSKDSTDYIGDFIYHNYYCPLNRKVVIPTPWYAEIGLPICMRQAPILDLYAFWRRFRGIGKHDIQVCIRLIKELFEVQVIH